MIIPGKHIKAVVDSLDAGIAAFGVRAFGEQAGLSCFLFHAIKEKDSPCPALFPQEELTLGLLDRFIETLLGYGYTFIGPEDVLAGQLEPGKKYGMLTFDDGYFNNTWSTEILTKYKVPAVFYITTRLVLQQEKQWADVIFFERSKRGSSGEAIRREIIQLIPERIGAIRDYITREFGSRSFVPEGDHDRPMTAEELHKFASHPLVYIGNHTHTHEPLQFLSREEVREELLTCQRHLKEITGKIPSDIAYPYGLYSDAVVDQARQLGFTLGMTTRQSKLSIPLDSGSLLTLPRLHPVARKDAINYDTLRSPVQFKAFLRKAVSTANRLF